MKVRAIAVSAMSEEQLSALLEALKADTGLQEKLKGAGDLDAAVAIAKQAGFDVSKADWLSYQAKQNLVELSDVELESAFGGAQMNVVTRQNTCPVGGFACTQQMPMCVF